MGFWMKLNPVAPARRQDFDSDNVTFSTVNEGYLKKFALGLIFMKYKEQIEATMTVNEFLRVSSDPSNRNYTNCHEIRSQVRRFIIPSYGRHTFFNGLLFFVAVLQRFKVSHIW